MSNEKTLENNDNKPVAKYVNFNNLTIEQEQTNGITSKAVWGTRNAFPRLYINKDIAIKGTFNSIILTFDTNALTAFLSMCLEAIDTPMEKALLLDVTSKNVTYENGEATDKLEVRGKLSLKRNEKGVFYLMVTTPQNDNFAFFLLPSPKWFSFSNTNTGEIDSALLSKHYTKGYFTNVMRAISMN